MLCRLVAALFSCISSLGFVFLVFWLLGWLVGFLLIKLRYPLGLRLFPGEADLSFIYLAWALGLQA